VEVVARRPAGTPVTPAWVGSASTSAFMAGSRVEASKPLRLIGTTMRSGSVRAISTALVMTSTGGDRDFQRHQPASDDAIPDAINLAGWSRTE
jgi:hypothetical protein